MLKKIAKIFNKEYPPYQLAIFVGVSTFLGFCMIFPLMFLEGFDAWGYAILAAGYFFISGEGVVCLVISILYGLISFLILKIISYRKLKKIIMYLFTIIFSINGVIFGFLNYQKVQKFISEKKDGKYTIWTVDTNGDKKPDKWVYDSISGKTLFIDYDSTGNGIADIREFYKDGKITRTESLIKNETN